MIVNKYILLMVIALIAYRGFAQQERKYIRAGNDYYNEAESDSLKKDSSLYEKAYTYYRRANEKAPEMIIPDYNMGNALYKQGKYKEAIERYKTAMTKTKDKDTLSKIFHNMGNSYFKSKDFENSINAYKNALKNIPADKETKTNLMLAQQMLQKQKQQQKQQQKNNKDKNNKDQKKDKQNKPDQNQEKEKEKNKEQQDKQNQEQQTPKQQQAKISKEDAEKMLKALQDQERKIQQRKMKKKGQQQQPNIEKDW